MKEASEEWGTALFPSLLINLVAQPHVTAHDNTKLSVSVKLRKYQILDEILDFKLHKDFKISQRFLRGCTRF